MYAKIFSQIFDSSIAENWQVRHVFQDMLILANRHGEVDMTVEAIARRTNTPLEIIQFGINELSKPDPISRTPNEDGRRILPLDEHRQWGWKIVNFAHYRGLKDEEMRREQLAQAQARWRLKQQKTPVIKRNHTRSHTEADTDTEGKAEKETATTCPEVAAPPSGLNFEDLTKDIKEDVYDQQGGLESKGAVVLEFPVVGRPPGPFRLWQCDVDDFSRLFPGVDILQQCRHALSWCKTNPTKRKTFGGMPRFLSGWLGRCQNNGTQNGQNGADKPKKLNMAEAYEKAGRERDRLEWLAQKQKAENGT